MLVSNIMNPTSSCREKHVGINIFLKRGKSQKYTKLIRRIVLCTLCRNAMKCSGLQMKAVDVFTEVINKDQDHEALTHKARLLRFKSADDVLFATPEKKKRHQLQTSVPHIRF